MWPPHQGPLPRLSLGARVQRAVQEDVGLRPPMHRQLPHLLWRSSPSGLHKTRLLPAFGKENSLYLSNCILQICGHVCKEPCGRPCLCRNPCQTACSHSSCPKRCGEPCDPCQVFLTFNSQIAIFPRCRVLEAVSMGGVATFVVKSARSSPAMRTVHFFSPVDTLASDSVGSLARQNVPFATQMIQILRCSSVQRTRKTQGLSSLWTVAT